MAGVDRFLKNFIFGFLAVLCLILFFMLTFGVGTTYGGNTDFYVLSAGEFDKSGAIIQSEKIKIVGGGGNIFVDDGKYNVWAFAYDDFQSAKEVRNSLFDEGLHTAIRHFSLNTRNISDEEKEFAIALMDISARIYRLIEKIDSGEIDMAGGKIILEEIQKSAVACSSRVVAVASDSMQLELANIATLSLSNCFSRSLNCSGSFSQSLKWLRCEILICGLEFCKRS